MLLCQYLAERGLLQRAIIPLSEVERFTFGERYQVAMRSGSIYDIPDLEDILRIMQTEFSCSSLVVEPRYREVYERPSARDPLGQVVKGIELNIYPVTWGRTMTFAVLDKGHFVDQVRRLVTNYNLTNCWDEALIKGDNYGLLE